MSLTTRTKIVLALAVAPLVVLAACGDEGPRASGPGSGGDGLASVVASFYPLEFVAERIGGPWVSVENLTPPGVEPHDVELTPKDVTTVADADLVVYLEGFSPAVDDAVSQSASDHAAFNVGGHAGLDLTYTPIEEGEVTPDGTGATDPHFWLDPTRLATVADELAPRLADLAPAHAQEIDANAEALRGELSNLDAELDAGLATCTSRDLVTSHNAFGYLAHRYDLRQVGIAGLTPAQEPSPQSLAEVADYVEAHDVATIYYETLVSPTVAETVSAETGAATAVLDPLEGLGDDAAGSDYLSVMRANLASLRRGQPCP
jgi:zinc transport system substrate-binding protein